MCLAVPGKIVSIDESTPPESRMAKVSFGGILKDVCIAAVPEVVVDDYVIVHVGFALQKLDEAEANEVFAYLEELGELEDALVAEAGEAQTGGKDEASKAEDPGSGQ